MVIDDGTFLWLAGKHPGKPEAKDYFELGAEWAAKRCAEIADRAEDGIDVGGAIRQEFQL